MCCFQAANRDPKVFPNPDSFDITRRPNPHLSFSFGPHVCIGQHVAKLEMRALYEEIVSRVKTIELNGEPRIKQANFVGGFKTMPIKFIKA
jgi:cytochrome P450